MQGERFEPTAEQRRTVRAMAGFGAPQEDIATFLDIDPKTLRKHFRIELDRGGIEATTKVAQSLFRMATEGNNVAAAIFWMKARAGWRDRHTVEHGIAPNTGGYCIISGVEREEELSEDPMQIAQRGRDEDEPEPEPERTGPRWAAQQQPRRGRPVIKVPRELSIEEWLAKYGRGNDEPPKDAG